MKTDHWNSNVKKFLTQYLEQTEKLLRIATGFFTVQGYDIIREYISGKTVRVLVGFDEKSRERLKELLIQDVMRHLSQWDAEDRREAVTALVDHIRASRFEIIEQKYSEKDVVDAKARNRDHAKVFIIDKSFVVVGSSNLTVSGLRYNTEGMTIVGDKERVDYWNEQFEKYWNADNTSDLTKYLLDALIRWLNLCLPFDIYLKTLLTLNLEDDTPAPRDSYKKPVKYQSVVIQRLLRQLSEHKGAMLVASTGLGKTIMATHTALLLSRQKEIFNVVIFAPLQVQPDWKKAMNSAGLNARVFTRNLLDMPSGKRKGAKMRDMTEALSEVDQKYIIFIDESQHFRNELRAKDGDKRHSFRRLREILVDKKPFIVLLTATPYSKSVNDVNNQLQLLPHTAPAKYALSDGQMAMKGMIDDKIKPEAWKVYDIEGNNFFDDFIKLPVTTVISTSQVAKNFAEHTDEGNYVLFGNSKRWIPKVHITKVEVPVIVEKEMTTILVEGYLKHNKMSFKTRGKWRITETTIQNVAEISWASSPLALERVIKKVVDEEYDVKYKTPKEKREIVCNTLLKKISTIRFEGDKKFQAFVRLIYQYLKVERRKVIVFTERLPTAFYLDEGINEILPKIKVACTVRKSENGEYDLKKFDEEVLPLIKGFAPEANKDKIIDGENINEYDLLILTDAYSTGVNLQDASVVIHYDLAWTPDVLIQRAGRILRFWKDPRCVEFVLFLGKFQHNQQQKRNTNLVEKRLQKLIKRSEGAQQFSEIPVIPKEDSTHYENLGDLSNVSIESLGFADISKIEEFSGVSPFLLHLNELQRNENYAKEIPNDISSALEYSGNERLLYLLLFYKDEYFRIIYNIDKKIFEKIEEDELLNLIQCKKDTQPATIDPDEIEKQAQKTRQLWMKIKKINSPDAVQRICALYIVPQRKNQSMKKIITKAIQT